MNKPESFEIAEYSEPDMNMGDAYGVIRQILVDLEADGKGTPSAGTWIDMTGNLLKVHYHGYEMHLPTRMKEVEDRALDSIKDLLSYVKKEFKSRTKATLKTKELKDLANYTVEKVSLNSRYYYRAWRVYEVSF